MLESDEGSSSEEESEEESESEADDASDDEKAMATAEQEGLETPSGLEYVQQPVGGGDHLHTEKRGPVCLNVAEEGFNSCLGRKDSILVLEEGFNSCIGLLTFQLGRPKWCHITGCRNGDARVHRPAQTPHD
jgi:hypothetical protein